MSTTRTVVTVICDKCGTRLASRWGTPRGARGEARRAGWQVAHVYGGAPSDDPIKGGDRCPECQPEKHRGVVSPGCPYCPSEPDAIDPDGGPIDPDWDAKPEGGLL